MSNLDAIEITDTIDSRDVIARIAFLEECELDDLLDSEEVHELECLRQLADQCAAWVADWEYGATLIADDYFTEYARELAEGCGFELPSADTWPGRHVTVDWHAAAEDLQEDYTSVTFRGTLFWVQ